MAALRAAFGGASSSDDTDTNNNAPVRILFVCHADPSKPLQRFWIEDWSAKQLWHDHEHVTTQLLLDPKKEAYQSWAIPVNNVASFGLKNTLYYIKAFFTRCKLPSIRGEPGQLGADFVVSPTGTVLLQHYCRDPTDRVNVRKIVQAVKGA